jgi:hypothetical protein
MEFRSLLRGAGRPGVQMEFGREGKDPDQDGYAVEGNGDDGG